MRSAEMGPVNAETDTFNGEEFAVRLQIISQK